MKFLVLAFLISIFGCRHTSLDKGPTYLASSEEELDQKVAELAAKYGIKDWGTVPTKSEWQSLNKDGNFSNYADCLRESPSSNAGAPSIEVGPSWLCSETLLDKNSNDFSAKDKQYNLPGIQILKAMLENYPKVTSGFASCLTTSSVNPPFFWSDIQLYYYCTFSAYYTRICYTGLVAGFHNEGGVKKFFSREEAVNLCSTGSYEGGTISFYSRSLNELSEVFNEQVGEQLDLFRFLMTSRTYAFPKFQQQKIINALFDVMADDGSLNCSKRPYRSVDKKLGSHCHLDKEYDKELWPTGR